MRRERPTCEPSRRSATRIPPGFECAVCVVCVCVARRWRDLIDIGSMQVCAWEEGREDGRGCGFANSTSSMSARRARGRLETRREGHAAVGLRIRRADGHEWGKRKWICDAVSRRRACSRMEWGSGGRGRGSQGRLRRRQRAVACQLWS